MKRGGGSTEAGGIYHAISRFVAKTWFLESEVERRTYLSLLRLTLAETDWRLLGYALMSSHIHLALVAGAMPMATWMRPLHTDFARWMNERRERIGAVFVKGPHVGWIQPTGLARLLNYIHSNPVRAGVVGRAIDSDWTSHRAYAGLAYAPEWLEVTTGLTLSGFASGSEFDNWVEATRVSRDELDAFAVIPRKRPGPQPRGELQVGHGSPGVSIR